MSRVRRRARPPKATMPRTPWDAGGDGPANRHRLCEEPATDVDASTGKDTPNPNGVRRYRRLTWLEIYHRAGKLDAAHVARGLALRMAAEGLPDRDPLAAIAAIRGGGGSDPLAAVVDSRRWFRRVMATIPQACRPIIERVAISDLPIPRGNSAARARHMDRLRAGLDAIGDA